MRTVRDSHYFSIHPQPMLQSSHFEEVCGTKCCIVDNAHLQGKQVRKALQPLHPPVHVIPQKQKLPGCDVHPQFPHVVGKKVQILAACWEGKRVVDKEGKGVR